MGTKELPLRLLLIEDSEDHALLLVMELRKRGLDPDFMRVETPHDLEAALDGNSWDAVIADYSMPAFTGLEALRIIKAKGLDLPFILVSGVIDEEKAIEAMKAGAHDFILKSSFHRLAPALERELRVAEVRRERQQALEDLHSAHEELEILVRHRTAELERTNEVLRAEISERKRTEDALRESQEQLQLFIEHAPAALAMFDIEMRYLSVSHRWLSDYGLGERALIGASHYEVFPKITANWREAHRRGLAGEVLRAEADRFERADGSVQWVCWEIRPWHDAEGKIGGIVIFTEDITDIKNAEKAQRESETRFRGLFENMLDGFAFCRMLFDDHDQAQDFIYLDVNSAFARLTGLNDVTGKKVTEVIPGIKETNPELLEIYGRVALTRQAEKFEIRVEPLGMWLSISVYSPERGYFVAVFDNITERKQAEKALQESMSREQERAEELATLLDAVPTPVFIAHDAECLHITGNPAADKLLCNPRGAEASLSAPAGVRPRHFRALKDGRELRLDELPAQRAARGTHVEDFEFSIAFDDGTTSHVLGYGTPLRDEEGRPRGAVHVLVDITERKRAVEALHDSERLYRAIGESIDYGIWTCAPDGRCTYASESFLRMVGMTQEQCSNFGWGDVLHPDDAENTIAAWKECVRTEGVWDIEHRFRGTDGQWHPVLARGVPVRNDRGELICWAGINLDIGRMKQAEHELRSSEEKFSTMLQTVPIAIALATLPDGALYNVNPAWLDLTGITSKEDAIGKTSLELGLIADAAQRQSILNEFRQNGFVRNVEQTFFTAKGVQRTVLVNLDRVEIDGRSFILSTMEEITERKRAEAALQRANENLELRVRERTEELRASLDTLSAEMAERQRTEKLLRRSEERYRKVVETQTETICRITADGVFTFINDAFCRDFGKTREELLGHKWQPYVFPDDVQHIKAQLATLSPSNPIVVIENRFYNGLDEIRWGQFVNSGLFDDEGRIIEIQAVGRDITERKLVEEELQAANSTMNRLVRTVAHEFRTPLGLLTGSTDILDLYWDRLTPEKRLEQNELIRNAARQISNLVNSVTSFQLSGTDRQTSPPLLQDMEDLCRSIAEEVETVWGAGHEFVVSIAADCGTVVLDDILFRRVLQNLLTNAFRYTPSTGTVSLHVCREKGLLLLEITDTGIGIPEEEQALIFDAFYRSRNVEGRRGLGLGLSIVRDALSQMGGTILVTSSTGDGTTMRVEIPVVDSV